MQGVANEKSVLSDAFAAFNEHSSRLEAAYGELRDQVSMLTRQLEIEQTRRHRELLEKERLGNRLLRTMEALPGAVLVLDGRGIVRERNRNAAELLNRPLIGEEWAEIVRRECAPRDDANGDLWLKTGRCLSLSRRSLAPEVGEILLLTDVSDTRRLADMLRRADRLSAIGEMTACLAHQIRTPVASALLNVSRLTSGEHGAVAQRVRDRLNDVGRIVDDMLRYASGQRRSVDEFSVAELFDEIAESYDDLTGSCRLVVDPVDAKLSVAGDRDALKGAIGNLIDNAQQAVHTSVVHVLAHGQGRDIRLSVQDDGAGISEETRARIFEPFFTTRPQGTGLGLAVVRTVAEAHGGRVEVESDDVGTTFTICLPRWENQK